MISFAIYLVKEMIFLFFFLDFFSLLKSLNISKMLKLQKQKRNVVFFTDIIPSTGFPAIPRGQRWPANHLNCKSFLIIIHDFLSLVCGTETLFGCGKLSYRLGLSTSFTKFKMERKVRKLWLRTRALSKWPQPEPKSGNLTDGG